MTALEKTGAVRPSSPLRGLRDAIRKIQGNDAEKSEAAGRIHGKMKLL
jgi:hypothetical protein